MGIFHVRRDASEWSVYSFLLVASNSIAMTRWSDCIGRWRGSIDMQSQMVVIRRSVVVKTDSPPLEKLMDLIEVVSGDCTVVGTIFLLRSVK